MLEIHVTITGDGKVSVDYSGFTGTTCLDEAKKFYALLKESGIHLEETRFESKPELDQSIATGQHHPLHTLTEGAEQ